MHRRRMTLSVNYTRSQELSGDWRGVLLDEPKHIKGGELKPYTGLPNALKGTSGASTCPTHTKGLFT